MARLKGWPGPGKSISLKTGAIISVNRGALVASWWPKKRGRPKSAVTREQNEWFRQANQLAKYADDQSQWMAIEVSKGSPWYPRDLLIAAMAGRLFETLNIDGVEFRSVAIRDDVSSDLDFLAGKVPGTIIVRGNDLWGALIPGLAGDVLTSAGPGALPFYGAGGGAGGLTYAGNIPVNNFSPEASATKGITIRPSRNIGFHSLGTILSPTVGHVFRGSISHISETFEIISIVAQTADITAPDSDRLYLTEPLLTPVTLQTNSLYALCWTRLDGTGSSVLGIANGNNASPMLGIPEKYFTPTTGIAPRVTMANNNLQPTNIFTSFNAFGYFLTALVSL